MGPNGHRWSSTTSSPATWHSPRRSSSRSRSAFFFSWHAWSERLATGRLNKSEAAEDLRFTGQGQFDERSDGLPALEATYGPFDWKASAIYDEGLKYGVLRNDEADITPAYTI